MIVEKSEARSQKSDPPSLSGSNGETRESPKSKAPSQKREPARSRARGAQGDSNRELHETAREAGTGASLPFRVSEPPPRPSPLSVLQILPRERQEQVFRYCETHSLKRTVRWLAKAGVKTSQASITRFRGFFHRRGLYEENLAIVKEMIEERRRNEPNVSEIELALSGRKMFAQLAIDTEDERSWARQQWVRQRQMKLDLERERFSLAREQFDFNVAEACLDHFSVIQAAVASPALSRYEKIERIHRVLCGKSIVETGCNGS